MQINLFFSKTLKISLKMVLISYLIEDRKKELTNKGYFDEKNKISLPKYPKRIGVLTSSSGSVIHDIIHRIKDRFPLTQILLYPI